MLTYPELLDVKEFLRLDYIIKNRKFMDPDRNHIHHKLIDIGIMTHF